MKFLNGFLALSLAAGLLVGCGGGDGGKNKIRLAFVTNNASDFWTIARRGTEKAEAEMTDVEVIFRTPSDGTVAQQKRILDDLLAMGVDGIAISPKKPSDQQQMLNDAAGRTLLITHDSDAPNSKRACYVGTDNVAAGVAAGEMIKEAIPDGGKIMMFVGAKDAQNAKERAEGIRQAIDGANIEILDIRTDDADHVRAKANVVDTLVNHDDVACLVGLWSYNGPAILSAVTEAEKLGKVQIVTFDEEDDTLRGVKEGHIHATIVQQPFEFGYQSIRKMADYIKGDTSVFPENKVNIVPTLTIKQNNVDEFKERLDSLRGRT
ncbi:MAG: sugar-binding protein [Verrucomicrobiota bacterium]